MSTMGGNQPIKNIAAEIDPPSGPGTRDAKNFRYEFTMPNDEVIHIHSTHNHGVLKLWKRAENAVETVDAFFARMGFPIYERMGFRTVGNLQWYVTPPPQS